MIATEFFDYQRRHPPVGVGGRCSPALQQLLTTLHRRWSTESLGCFGPRAIRGGELPSTHSYGAAVDVNYGDAHAPEHVQLCGYLVAWSEEWGIQAIHDYVECRIWRAGRTTNPAEACSKWWRAQRPDSNGMGSEWAHWLHVEVRPDRWADYRTEAQRNIT